MGTAAAVATKPKKRARKTKNPEVKTNCVAPSDWVTTLLHAKDGGSSVLVEFRSGRNGAPMLAESIPFQTLDGSAHESVVPLAVECWDAAKIHRGELTGARYDYRVRVISVEEDGSFTAMHESEWVELAEGDGDIMSLPAGMESRNWTEQMLSGMVLKLFTANIQLTRASGALVREMSAGSKERLESEFHAVDKLKQMAMELVAREREMAMQEGDAKEVEEFGKTARQWMQMGHEEKLAKQGVKSPDVPTTRKSAAISLWNSITVAQLEAFKNKLGEKSELILGLIQNAGEMDEDQIADVFKEHLGGGDGLMGGLELVTILGSIFHTDFVPSTWAIWQARTAQVLIEGPKEKPDA